MSSGKIRSQVGPISVEHMFVVAFLLIGVVLRSVQLDYNFDGDEVSSVRLATAPLFEALLNWPHTGHPPLHIVLLHFWLKMFGESETAARSLSICFSTGFLFFSYLTLRKFAKPVFSILLLGILCASPYFVYLGQQARPYSLLLLLTATNLYFYLTYLHSESSSNKLAVWTFLNILLVYTQYFAIFLIFSEIVFAACRHREKYKTLLVFGLVPVVLVAPWVWTHIVPGLSTSSSGFSTISWIEAPTFTSLAWFYVDVFGGGYGLLQARWLLLTIAVMGSLHFWSAMRGRQGRLETIFIYTVCFGLPILIFLISTLTGTSIWGGRHLASAALCLVVLLGMTTSALPRWLSSIGVGLLFIVSISSTWNAFPQHSKPPWRAVADFATATYGADVIVVDEAWTASPLEYYSTSSTVKMATRFGADAQRRALYVCRNVYCENGLDSLGLGQLAPLRRFEWGSEDNSNLTILVFEVAGTVSN